MEASTLSSKFVIYPTTAGFLVVPFGMSHGMRMAVFYTKEGRLVDLEIQNIPDGTTTPDNDIIQ
jgi:hypothetical protein